MENDTGTGNVLRALSDGVRKELLDVFDGDKEAAREAVMELVEHPEVLQGWATRMLQRHDHDVGAEMFEWSQIPPSMKDGGKVCLAMAYLIETGKP